MCFVVEKVYRDYFSQFFFSPRASSNLVPCDSGSWGESKVESKAHAPFPADPFIPPNKTVPSRTARTAVVTFSTLRSLVFLQ